ncbi:DUF3152 domain-containing protein [Saccharothrix syringae]|uniref:DUF3152 domain-containing protein n=1 Tax=Saccharothrix syringae TaxID=103733 RepID=A0A5Q0H5Z2_SACSY|nr:DUF3152 domain-containing protein [Saccharothrix syringae]QFZ21658.1 DUF3152 domain-containing protein [Saccharothrix syringae]
MRLTPFVPYLAGVCLAATAVVALELRQEGRPAIVEHPSSAAPGTSGTSVSRTPGTPPGAPPADRLRRDADLPPGPPVPRRGAGTWRVVPGGFGTTGTPYSVEVEDGVVPPRGDAAFAAVVDHALAHPRGWRASGHAFRRVDRDGAPELRIRLTSQQTARALCGFELPYDTSCRVGSSVYLSAARWLRGAHAFGRDLRGYRAYAVNHEVGHFLGHGHEVCPVDGAPAPVMMQQTLSTDNDELAAITSGTDQGVAVTPDGRSCTANPWPSP